MNRKTSEDRRRFFRIVDKVSVVYKPTGIPVSGDDTPDNPPKDLISSYNESLKAGMASLQQSSPEAAEAIDLLNKKLDLLFSLMELSEESQSLEAVDIAEASLSACGIGFPVSESFSPETPLSLVLFLKPSEHRIEAEGRVVSCQPIGDDKGNYLRVEFTEMHHQGREKLIQHIVQRQGVILKNLREQMDD